MPLLPETGVAESDGGRYRYAEALPAGGGGAPVLFIDLRHDRLSARRAAAAASRLGAAEAVLCHLFGFVAEDASDLLSEGDPAGPEADAWLAACLGWARGAGARVVCAWGGGGSFLERDRAAMAAIAAAGVQPCCLGTDRHGFPLTLAKGAGDPRPYEGRPDD